MPAFIQHNSMHAYRNEFVDPAREMLCGMPLEFEYILDSINGDAYL